MPSLIASLRSVALGAAALASTVVPVSAGPASGLAAPSVLSKSRVFSLERVQYRRHNEGRRSDRDGGYRNRGNGGRNLALGIGGLIIGGIILSEAARSEHRRDHGLDWQRCAATYRSFETETGLYTGYDGIRRPCPYLR